MLVVVRHGRTASNRAGLLLGRSDPGLDDLGRRQAAAVAAALGPVDRVVASPLLRTRETAAAVADAAGVTIEVDERWIEVDYGDWDGRPVAEVDADTWAQWRADPDFAPPGGESLAAVDRRVRAACAELIADAADRTVVVVSHVSPIKATLAWALGVHEDQSVAVSWRSFVTPASVMRIGVGPAGPSLRVFNDQSHLAGVE